MSELNEWVSWMSEWVSERAGEGVTEWGREWVRDWDVTSRGCSCLKHVTLAVLLLTVNVCSAQNGTCHKNTHTECFVGAMLGSLNYQKSGCSAASTGAHDSISRAHAVHSVQIWQWRYGWSTSTETRWNKMPSMRNTALLWALLDYKSWQSDLRALWLLPWLPAPPHVCAKPPSPLSPVSSAQAVSVRHCWTNLSDAHHGASLTWPP